MRHRRGTAFLIPCLLPCLLLACSHAPAAPAAPADAGTDNWPRWRGPHDNGGNESAGGYPVSWSADKGLLWKADLPGKGCSTPVVSDKRIFLTAPVEGQDAVLAFDWAGKELWRTPVGAERRGKSPNGSGTNPSASTDGQSVFAYFKSGDLAALDLDGKLYAARQDGVVFVARVEPTDGGDGKFEVLSKNEMGERLIASPVPVAGRALIRGDAHLFCAGKE